MSNDSGREPADDDEVSPDAASSDADTADAAVSDSAASDADTGVSPLEGMVGGIEDAIAGVNLRDEGSEGSEGSEDPEGEL